MNMLSGLFMGEYLAYSTSSAAAIQNETMESYMARNADAMRNAAPSFMGLQNAYQPSAHERDRRIRDALGIPAVMEDIQ
jgi:hypothetical protein